MSRHHRKKKKGRGHTIAIGALFVAEIAIILIIVFFFIVQGLLGKLKRVNTTPEDVVAASDETFEADSDAGEDTVSPDDLSFDADIEVMSDDEVRNLLLIGQDRREGEGRQRSDTMIICSINTRDSTLTLTSLMRDMYVPIPDYSPNRINAAYIFGGMDLLDRVIEENFGIHIDGNIEVDFDGFLNSLAYIGDLELELTEEEAEYLNGGDWEDQGGDSSDWELHEGMNVMTPDQVLAYARTRKVGKSDYDRTERQRTVMMAAFDKVKDSSLPEQLSIANKILPNLVTDMSDNEVLGYVTTVATHDLGEIKSYRVPVDGTFRSETIKKMAVLVPDLAENSAYLEAFIYRDGPKYAEVLEMDAQREAEKKAKEAEDNAA